MLNTNFNAYYVQQPFFYPFGYQYFIMPAPIALTNTQIINPLIQINDNLTQSNNISIGLNQQQGDQKLKSISETESHIDSDNDNEEPRDTPFHPKSNKPDLTKNIQKPNLLVKSTNIQKNYAKAIVSYACRQRTLIYETLGEERGEEFIKLMSRLKNKLRNIAHITNYTHNFRKQFYEERLNQLYLQFQDIVEELSFVKYDNCKEFSIKVLISPYQL